jgi:hypothetical protein
MSVIGGMTQCERIYTLLGVRNTVGACDGGVRFVLQRCGWILYLIQLPGSHAFCLQALFTRFTGLVVASSTAASADTHPPLSQSVYGKNYLGRHQGAFDVRPHNVVFTY